MTSKVYAKILIDNISSLLNSDGEDSADSYEEEVQEHKIYLIKKFCEALAVSSVFP